MSKNSIVLDMRLKTTGALSMLNFSRLMRMPYGVPNKKDKDKCCLKYLPAILKACFRGEFKTYGGGWRFDGNGWFLCCTRFGLSFSNTPNCNLFRWIAYCWDDYFYQIEDDCPAKPFSVDEAALWMVLMGELA